MSGVITASESVWIAPFTGLSPRAFGRLLTALRREGAGSSGRGRPWKLSLEDRVLLVTAYWRTNLTMRQLAPLFGVSKSAADRVIDDLGPRLALRPRRRFAKEAVLIVDGTLVPTGDQVAHAAQQAALAVGDVVLDPFAPTPLDPATLTGTPAERLAQVEAALRAADAHAGRSVRAAKIRWTIEKGAALQALVDHDLYLARGFTSLDAYAAEVLHISRDNVYKTIEAATALRAVLDADRVSKIFYTPPNVSQAKALAPLLALDGGEDKAVKVVTDVQESGKKLTAAAITATAARLGYITRPTRARYEELDADLVDQLYDEAGEKANAKLAAAADAAERALALYEEALALGAPPADPARADADLARLTKTGRVLGKQTRIPGA